MIFIKLKAGASLTDDKDVGILLDPDVIPGEVNCDAELYRMIDAIAGPVRIAVGLFGRHGEQVLTAQEFCAQWKGD